MPIHKVGEMRLSEVPGANGGGWVEIRLQGAYASLLAPLPSSPPLLVLLIRRHALT